MDINELIGRIDDVIDDAGDPEGFHAAEDQLMIDWIRSRASESEVDEWDRLWSGDFVRWYA